MQYGHIVGTEIHVEGSPVIQAVMRAAGSFMTTQRIAGKVLVLRAKAYFSSCSHILK